MILFLKVPYLRKYSYKNKTSVMPRVLLLYLYESNSIKRSIFLSLFLKNNIACIMVTYVCIVTNTKCLFSRVDTYVGCDASANNVTDSTLSCKRFR